MGGAISKVTEICRRAGIGPERLSAWIDWAAAVTRDNPAVRDRRRYFLAVLDHGLGERDSDQPPQPAPADAVTADLPDIEDSRYLHIYR
jgi:hypothetical protein